MIIIKSFALDETGDLLIQNNEIQMVENEELIKQTVKTILNTNKGEWFNDWNEGIEFSNIQGKNVTEDTVMSEIKDGLQQVDEYLDISDFSMNIDERALSVKFTATNENENIKIEVATEWD